MGSSHSTTIQTPPNEETIPKETVVVEKGSNESTPRKKKQPPPHLSGPQLVEFKCRKKKKAWTRCVSGWYSSRFLPGEALEEEQADCDELFERFRECYMRNMLKEREKQGLGPPKENTMLSEFMEEEGIQPDNKQ